MERGYVRRGLLGSLLSLAIMLLLLAPAVGAQGANAMVRVAHMSPDAPAVDVYAGGNRVLSNVPFGTVSNYLSVPAGTIPIKVLPAGAPAGDRGVIEANLPVAAGRAYTVEATGRLAQIGATVLNDDLSAPPAGKAKVRLVHASPDAPAVDVAVKGGPVLFSNVAFRSASPYAEVAAGTYDLEVRPAGTTTVALAVPGVTIPAGAVISVFAQGLLQGQPALRANPVIDSRGGTPPGMPTTGAGGMAGVADSLTLAGAALLLSLVAGAYIMRRQARRA